MRLIRFRNIGQGGPRLGVFEEGHTDAPGTARVAAGIGPVTTVAAVPGHG